MASRRYTVVLADRKTGVVRRITFSARPAMAGVLTIVLLPILIGVGAARRAQWTIQDLQQTNAALVVENESYRGATGQLASQISALQAAVDDLGPRAAVDPAASRAMEKLPAMVRNRAMGGGTVAAAALGSAFGSPDAFGVMRDLLGAIEERLQFVRTGVERREALAAATPTIWPVTGWLSSSYGNRRDPFTGNRDFHPGLDISADSGEPVLATADGLIVSAERNGSYGNLVVVEHGFGIVTKYGHLSRFGVGAGQRVRRGHVVGYVGSTGRSTSPHLHYEIWINGQLTNPMRLLAAPTSGR
jgi:murein DD-endopeptidase MepM/ murein hydrolase activator NlpD